MMKLKKIILFVVAAIASACNSEEDFFAYDSALEINGIAVAIDGGIPVTRAVSDLKETIGRDTFAKGDIIVFDTIRRTVSPLDSFIYKNIKYTCDGKNWSRVEGNTPEKIYWSDAASAHTFIGYSLPQGYTFLSQDASGCRGKISNTNFSGGNDVIKNDDVLLCYRLDTKAETGGLTTKVSFSHALSNVRVVVNISGYAATTSAVDTNVVVNNMVIENQPIEYTWNLQGSSVEDASNSVTADITLWCPKNGYESNGQSKTFTFYGLAVPHIGDVPFSFKVTYPDPMDKNKNPTKTYKGSFSGVKLESGKCTTLNISLNHQNEQMYVDVKYSDWNYVATPDIGELRKKSTYMDIESKVTIHTEANATADDATWLYGSGNNIKDIYGNDGSQSSPYRISTASQLLSFAKEVKGGLAFDGKFVRLDADITMQSSTAKTSVEDTTKTNNPITWIGVGDAEHPFNGTFLGGDRYINRLYGNPLFVNLGDSAHVEQLYVCPIGTVKGGALAGTNSGVIGACKVIDEVTVSSADDGALVGTNSGTVYACYHTGNTKLVGRGETIGCYIASDINSFDDASLKTFVEKLNQELTDNNLTKYQYEYSVGSYPTVKKQ